MKIASLGIAVALGAAPVVAHAQVSFSGGISFDVGAAPGDAVGSVDVFYDQLSPYGVWVDDPVVGEAFIPDEANYTPYTNGHWEMTDVGFVWVSSEPFAWATSHYGRWFYSDDYGRWMWIPDTTWGPNWVDWYESGDSFGWAPLAPDVVVSAGYSTPDWAYHFAPSDRILATDVSRYYVPRDRVEVIRRDARPITHREQGRDHQVIVGPAPERLQAHRIQARPHKADLKTVGRMNATELRAAEQRAETRKPQIERQNQQRLEQHAQIKKVVETRATKAPANLNRTQPARPGENRPENRAQPNRADENRAQPNRTDENRAQPNRTDENRAQPARPEPRGVTPGATDRGDTNRARPDRANDRGDENRATPARPDENRPRPDDNRARPEPRATAPAVDRTPNRPEPKAAPTPRPEPQAAPTPRPEPQTNRPAPTPRPEPQRAEPRPEPRERPEATMPRPEPQRAEPRPEPQRAEPRPEPQHAEPRPEPQRAEPRPEPQREPRETSRPEPQHAAPSRPEPQATRPEPTPRAEPKGHAEGHGDKRKNEH